MRIVRIAALTLAVTAVMTAQTTAHAAGSVPRSALPGAKSIDSIQRMVMPDVDVAELLAEDAAKENSGVAAPSRFATAIPVLFATKSAGSWETLDDGSKLWRLRIASPGALSLNLGIEKFDLPAGATFWIHDADGAQVQGPYTAKNRNAAGGLWTAVVLGDELVAELHLPAGSDGDLEISSVNHGYRFFAKDTADAADKRGTCNINVVCPDGDPWSNQIRSVARITISGMFVCTGQLVNNTAQDDTPYFLTAGHCIEFSSEAPSVVAYWNFQSPQCNDFAGGNLSQNQSGSTWVASSPLEGVGSDFTLVELDQNPDPSWNLFFLGWDAREQVPNSTTTIHHPSGDEKSISFDFDPPTITQYLENSPTAGGTHWRIADWNEGTTEGGSSGSCLYDDSSKRCVGTLSGGYAACGNDDSDWYGRTAKQWTGGGTDDTRLSTWLDKANTGAMFLDGKNAEGASGDQYTWLIPAVASAPGVAPTYWRSQVAVVNPTTESRSVSLYFVAKNQPWPGVLLSGPTTVAPNKSLYLSDPLATQAPATGLIYITVDGSGMAVSARTSTPAAGGGSYGQGQPGILLSSNSSVTGLDSADGPLRTGRFPDQCRLCPDFLRHHAGQGPDLLEGRRLAGAEELLAVGRVAAGERRLRRHGDRRAECRGRLDPGHPDQRFTVLLDHLRDGHRRVHGRPDLRAAGGTLRDFEFLILNFELQPTLLRRVGVGRVCQRD